ncbi:OLC1v1001618C1 [Oldenlandia corymbosa var. corymbosa]|uniref:OLC1v1001618C1 n=1 Tax=Oldenlandia corymbosa var. corymbosa TaxID=529605 RepID=A0AAV1D8K5_OLDCO|nr:OLC1v1001618C1 [Oldenlandia corymbosa var. corymbosa]
MAKKNRRKRYRRGRSRRLRQESEVDPDGELIVPGKGFHEPEPDEVDDKVQPEDAPNIQEEWADPNAEGDNELINIPEEEVDPNVDGDNEFNIQEELVNDDGIDELNVPGEGVQGNVNGDDGLNVPEEGVEDNVAEVRDDGHGDQGKGIRHYGADDDMPEKHLDDDLKYNDDEHERQIEFFLIMQEMDKSCSSFRGGHEFLKKEMKQAVKIVPPDWIRNVICWVLHLPGDDEGNPPAKYSFLDAGTSSDQAEDEDLEEAVPENPAGLQALDDEHGEVHHDGEIDNIEQGTEANIRNVIVDSLYLEREMRIRKRDHSEAQSSSAMKVTASRSYVCLQNGSKKRLITRPHKIGCAVCGFKKLPEYMARASCKCRGYFICVKDCLINLAMAEAQKNIQIICTDCKAHLLEERLVPRLLQWLATRSRN